MALQREVVIEPPDFTRAGPERHGAAELRTSAAAFAERAEARINEAAAEVRPAATRTAWSPFAALLGLLTGMEGAEVGRRNAGSRTDDRRDEPREATMGWRPRDRSSTTLPIAPGRAATLPRSAPMADPSFHRRAGTA